MTIVLPFTAQQAALVAFLIFMQMVLIGMLMAGVAHVAENGASRGDRFGICFCLCCVLAMTIIAFAMGVSIRP